MKCISASVADAAARLQPCSESPRLDAELLLGQVLGLSRTALLVRRDETLSAALQRDFDALIERRRGGEPVAYLTGSREFWSLPLRVNAAVLVPRPETEVLVESALQLIPAQAPVRVLDLGTGSGAIALAIATERTQARIVATDVSPAALAVARDNARWLGLDAIDWREGSWFDPVAHEHFDFILSNPPYIAAADPALAALGAEPRGALTPGPTGLEAFELIVATAVHHLSDGGWLVLEHGSGQGPQLAALLALQRFQRIRTAVDHSGLPRVTLGTIHDKT
jgi:release factor glutamine methyltransferase